MGIDMGNTNMLYCGHRARNSHQLERKVVPMVNTSDVVAIIGIVLAAFELGFIVGQAKK